MGDQLIDEETSMSSMTTTKSLETIIQMSKPRRESTESSDNLIATRIGGKFFWHQPEIVLSQVCTHLPSREGRTIFGVTLFDPFLFYHDRDLVLRRSQPFIMRLFENASPHVLKSPTKIEYLVTRKSDGSNRCKFELLGDEFSDDLPATSKSLGPSKVTPVKEISSEKSTVQNPELPVTNGTNKREWSINTWLQGGEKSSQKGIVPSKSRHSLDTKQKEKLKSILMSAVEHNQKAPSDVASENAECIVIASTSEDTMDVIDITEATTSKRSSIIPQSESCEFVTVATIKGKTRKQHEHKISDDKQQQSNLENSNQRLKNHKSSKKTDTNNNEDNSSVNKNKKKEEKLGVSLMKKSHSVENHKLELKERVKRSERSKLDVTAELESSSLNCCEDTYENDDEIILEDKQPKSKTPMRRTISKFLASQTSLSASSSPSDAFSSPSAAFSAASKHNWATDSHNKSLSNDSPTTGAYTWSWNNNKEKGFGPSDALVEYFKKKSTEWAPYRRNLIDSHCHFDMLFDKMGYKKTVKSYFEDFKDIYLDNFEACMNIICDPRRYEKPGYKQKEYLASLKHTKVRSSIGCHPHFSKYWTDMTAGVIASLIGTNGIIAIGECGLDSSYKNSVPYEQQVVAFEGQLNIANERNVPLVIHCRDAEAEVFEIMKKNLSPSHRIHLHCFTGGWEIGKQYLDHFSNLCIGLTPLITRRENNRMIQLAQNAPIDRLLLETDAPYFVPSISEFPGKNSEHSHPAFVFATAEQLATMRNVSVNEVLDINRRNVNKVYGF